MVHLTIKVQLYLRIFVILCVVACDWTGLFEVVSSKKAVVVLLIYLQEAMYNKSVDENTTNQ